MLAADPGDGDVAESASLVEIDQSVFEQFEYGKESHNDLDPVDQSVGETSKGHAPDAGQLLDDLGNRIDHVRPDGCHMIEHHLWDWFGSDRSDERRG